MTKWLKQLFCRHDYKFVRKITGVQQNIWSCKKCGQRYLQAYGLGIGCKIKDNEYLSRRIK